MRQTQGLQGLQQPPLQQQPQQPQQPQQQMQQVRTYHRRRSCSALYPSRARSYTTLHHPAPRRAPQWAAPAFADPFQGGPFGALAPWAGLGALVAPGGCCGGAGGLGSLLAPLMSELGRAQHSMKLDVIESDKEVRLVADLPGVAMRDIQIEVGADNVLTISAEQVGCIEKDEMRVRTPPPPPPPMPGP